MIFLKTLNEIVQAITSPSILDELAELIRTHDKTFPQEEAIYHEAVEDLKRTMSPHSVDEYIRACQTEVVANILYAAYEGYRANPMAMLTGYMQRYTGIRTLGLCHSVQVCTESLLKTLGMDDKIEGSTDYIAGINHMLTVEAARTKKLVHIYQAAMLDPHTSSELDIDTIKKMVDELIEAHGDYLPKYSQ